MQFPSIILILIFLVEASQLQFQKKRIQEAPPWIHPGSQVAILRRSFLTDIFDRVAQDVFCTGGERLLRTSVKGVMDCRDKCFHAVPCSHFAYWPKEKRCETYVDCPNLAEDGKKIQLWFRATSCEAAILPGSSDRGFLMLVESEFPGHAVHHEGPSKNMQCSCIAEHWMICAIFVNPESTDPQAQEFERIVRSRLKTEDKEALDPFHLVPSEVTHLSPSLIYRARQAGHTGETIYAEFEITPVENCIDINICITGTPDGYCPVLGTLFDSRQPVYIFRSDIALLKQGKPVKCISVAGMRLGATADVADRGILDPFSRDGDRRMYVNQDYAMFWIFDEEDLKTETCQNRAIMLSQKNKRRGAGKKKKKAPGSSEAGPSSSESFGMSPSESFGASPSEEAGPFDNIPAAQPEDVSRVSKLVRKMKPFDMEEISPLPRLSRYEIQREEVEKPSEAGSSIEPSLERDSSTEHLQGGDWMTVGRGGKVSKQHLDNQNLGGAGSSSGATPTLMPTVTSTTSGEDTSTKDKPAKFQSKLNPLAKEFVPIRSQANVRPVEALFYRARFHSRTSPKLESPVSPARTERRSPVTDSGIPEVNEPNTPERHVAQSIDDTDFRNYVFVTIIFTILLFTYFLQQCFIHPKDNVYVEF